MKKIMMLVAAMVVSTAAWAVFSPELADYQYVNGKISVDDAGCYSAYLFSYDVSTDKGNVAAYVNASGLDGDGKQKAVSDKAIIAQWKSASTMENNGSGNYTVGFARTDAIEWNSTYGGDIANTWLLAIYEENGVKQFKVVNHKTGFSTLYSSEPDGSTATEWADYSGSVVIPEPTSGLLMVLGLGLMALRRRHRA